MRFMRVRPGHRGCDACGAEIVVPFSHHCESCDFDLCWSCYVPSDELLRLGTELAELETSLEEQEAADALELNDLQLQRVTLTSQLQRYPERPSVEEVAARYEGEIEELGADVCRLKEENGRLACEAASPRRTRQLLEEAEQLRHVQQAGQKRRRQVQLMEWRLECSRAEMQVLGKVLRSRERALDELRHRHGEAEGLLKQLESDQVSGREAIERERRLLHGLHREIVGLREACYEPAQLTKRSSALMKSLEGRTTEKHLRSLQACRKLYDAVSVSASMLLAYASRVKTAFDETFARYLRLANAHSQLLHRLHLGVAKGVLRDT